MTNTKEDEVEVTVEVQVEHTVRYIRTQTISVPESWLDEDGDFVDEDQLEERIHGDMDFNDSVWQATDEETEIKEVRLAE